jgi:hypothetical protein
MKQPRFVKFTSLVAAVVLMAVLATTAYAMTNNEPFESENFSTYGGRKDGTFSLTYAGRGFSHWWDRCDWNDYIFRINVYRSYPGSDWKMYSGYSRFRNTPSGRAPYGHNLDSSNAHVCFGATEFDPGRYPYTYWTTSNVQYYVYTWRR